MLCLPYKYYKITPRHIYLTVLSDLLLRVRVLRRVMVTGNSKLVAGWPPAYKYWICIEFPWFVWFLFDSFALFSSRLLSKKYVHWTNKNILMWYKFVSVLTMNPIILFCLDASSLSLSGTNFYETMCWITGYHYSVLAWLACSACLVCCVTAWRVFWHKGTRCG